MTAREILELGHPLLWQPSSPVAGAAATVRPLVDDLAATLAAFREAHGFGRGIAAPQIGRLQRVIFIAMPAGFRAGMVDPQIVSASDEQIELWDDCFSLPNLMVRVRRAARVVVRWRDVHDVVQTTTAEGDLSELLQHEIDHLDGILAVQRAVSDEALCTRAEWERRYRSGP